MFSRRRPRLTSPTARRVAKKTTIAERKTKRTIASVDDVRGALEDDQVQRDSRACGKSLYIKRLADIHLPTLKKIVGSSVKHLRERSRAADRT